MKSKLDTLITCYEQEKERLLQLIENCIQEQEYQLAYFHNKALIQLNTRLQTLKNIDDRFYDEKSFILGRIANLEKRIEAESSDAIKEYYSKELSYSKGELEKLIQRSIKSDEVSEGLILTNTLLDLLDKKIKSFKLILKKKDALFLEFKYFNKTLNVTIPSIKKHLKNWVLYDNNIDSLRKLGFEFIANDSALSLKIKDDKEKILSKLNIFLSKIVFEIFYFKEFQNDSYIEINTKPNNHRNSKKK